MKCEHCGEPLVDGERSIMIPLVESASERTASVRPCWYHQECAAALVIGWKTAPGISKRDAARAALDDYRAANAWD